MADSNFLMAALDLLGRPGNAVRGALIDGPQGLGQGLAGQRQYDPTELPGINQLPDEGLSMGPLHLTPRTVGGFAAGTALDPLTYLGGGLGHLGLGHAGEIGGSLGRFAADEAGELRIPTGRSIMDSLGAAGLDPQTSKLEDLVGHLNQNGHNLAIADSPEQAEAQVAAGTGSEAHVVQPGRQPGAHPLLPDRGPRNIFDPATARQTTLAGDNEPTPVGPQKYAQAKDRIGGVQATLNQKVGDRGNAEQWLTQTSKADVPPPADETWEDVVGVKRGTAPEDALTAQEGEVRRYKGSRPDLAEGPGLTSQYRGESVGFSRQEVLSHLSNLQAKIEELTQTLSGDRDAAGKSTSQFGDPAKQRGQNNYLADAVARQQLRGTPELEAQRQQLEASSTSRLPGLSKKQETLAYKKAGAQQLSKEETDRRAPGMRYYNAGSPEAAADEANLPTMDRGTRAPHGDPLEEDRATKETNDKFGRQGPGTYQAGDNGTQLGVDENRRGAGAGGRGFTEEIIPAKPGDYSRVVTQHSTEPTAGLVPQNQELSLAIERIRTEAILQAIKQEMQRPLRGTPPPPSGPNRFLGR